ncbi:MAG: hypothetical protein ACK47B_14240 [Armatimonadota bacterium]
MTRLQSAMTPDEIGRRGEALYERELRSRLEETHRGQFLALDVMSGRYQIAEDDLTATTRLMDEIPGATVYTLRIGRQAAYQLSGGFRQPQSGA